MLNVAAALALLAMAIGPAAVIARTNNALAQRIDGLRRQHRGGADQ